MIFFFLKKFNIFLGWNKKIHNCCRPSFWHILVKEAEASALLFSIGALWIGYQIYQEMDAIDRSKTDYLQLFIYDVNKVSTSKIQKVRETFASNIF